MKKATLIIFILCIGLVSNAKSEITDGLVAYYPFNGNTNDESIHENHATNFGAQLTTNRFGEPNSAYSFDGVSNYMQLPNIIPPFVGAISYWYKTESNTESQVLVYHSSINSDGFGIGPGSSYIENHTAISALGYNYFVFDNGLGTGVTDSIVPVRINTWYHVILTYDVADSARMYVNGNLVCTKDLSAETATNIPTMTYIGKPGQNTRYFNGVFDDLRIYDRTLDTDEIQALYYETLRSEFVVDKKEGFAPFSVNFSDQSVSDIEIISWQWDFDNDGIIDSDEQNPQFVFETGGLYSPKLIVSDGVHTDSIEMYEMITVYDLSNQLSRYYNLNGDANDITGNELHGEVNGALSTDRFGVEEQAYEFYGENNITVPSLANWGDYLTISFWFYTDSCTSNQILIGSRAGSSGATYVNMRSILQPDSTVTFLVASFDSNDTKVVSQNKAEMHAWNHVICEIDLVNDTEKIVLNGVENSIPYTFNPRYLDLAIGFGNWREGFSSTSGLHGKIDEIRFYNRILLAAEKELLFNEIFPMADNFGIVAKYDFLDSVNDLSGNENHGTVNGATPAMDRFGVINSAYEFSGNENRIDIGANVKPTNFPIYISAWIKPNTIEGTNTIVTTDTWDATNNVFCGTTLQLTDGEIVAGFGICDGAETSDLRIKTTTGAAIPEMEWTYIVAGIHAHDDIRIFVNDDLIEGVYEGDATQIGYTEIGIGFIGNKSDFSQAFNGVIDDLSIYNRFMYAYEMEQIFNQKGMTTSQSVLNFNQIEVGEVSVEQVFALNAFSLNSNVEIMVSENFEISLTTGSEFLSQLSLSHVNGAIRNIPVFVRFSPQNVQTYDGQIVVSSEGFEDIVIELSGVGFSGISEAITTGFVLYPNPVSDQLHFSSEAQNVVFYNLLGTRILEQNNVSKIDVQDMSSGFYLVVITDNNIRYTQKVLVK